MTSVFLCQRMKNISVYEAVERYVCASHGCCLVCLDCVYLFEAESRCFHALACVTALRKPEYYRHQEVNSLHSTVYGSLLHRKINALTK